MGSAGKTGRIFYFLKEWRKYLKKYNFLWVGMVSMLMDFKICNVSSPKYSTVTPQDSLEYFFLLNVINIMEDS